jgi:hypothetical protein
MGVVIEKCINVKKKPGVDLRSRSCVLFSTRAVYHGGSSELACTHSTTHVVQQHAQVSFFKWAGPRVRHQVINIFSHFTRLLFGPSLLICVYHAPSLLGH